eukprot:COSAG04_NODE_239_length_19076_cov_18.359138_16_plen_176_part_00
MPPKKAARIPICCSQTSVLPYICARKATPLVASGGVMLGCAGGHWVMGTPYKQVDSLSYLPPTIVSSRPPSDLHTHVNHVLCTQVYGAYTEKVYRQITPTKVALNETTDYNHTGRVRNAGAPRPSDGDGGRVQQRGRRLVLGGVRGVSSVYDCRKSGLLGRGGRSSVWLRVAGAA